MYFISALLFSSPIREGTQAHPLYHSTLKPYSMLRWTALHHSMPRCTTLRGSTQHEAFSPTPLRVAPPRAILHYTVLTILYYVAPPRAILAAMLTAHLQVHGRELERYEGLFSSATLGVLSELPDQEQVIIK